MAYMAEKAIREQQPHDVLKSKHLMVTSDSCQLEPPDRRWQKSLSLSLSMYIYAFQSNSAYAGQPRWASFGLLGRQKANRIKLSTRFPHHDHNEDLHPQAFGW